MSRDSNERVPSDARRVDLSPLKQLWPFIKPYRRTLIWAALALLAAASASLSLPVGVRFVIDEGFAVRAASAANSDTNVDKYFLILFVLAALLAVFSGIRFYLVSWLGERVVADVRAAVYEHIMTLSPSFFEATRTGEILSRLTTDTTLVQSVAGVNLSIILRSAVSLLGGSIMLALTNGQLAGVIALLIPVVLIPLLFYGRRVRRLSRDTQDRVADASGLAGETINAIQTVQAFTLERHWTRRFTAAVGASFDTAVRRIKARALLIVFSILITFGAIVFVLWLGAHAVIDDSMSLGELGQFLLYSLMVAGSAASLSEMWGELQKAAGAFERITELLQARCEITVPANPNVFAQPVLGRVSFEAVSFHYPSRPESAALCDLSLTVEPGETLALVGPSGAGKSTVAQLLLRFYDPDEGCVRIDGVDIATTYPSAVRAAVGFVPQETVLFADSVLENVRQGNREASDKEVMEAAFAAGVTKFTETLKGGLHTPIGERGVRLSGGQRQRIAIARAILKDPSILLLDEATSALDAESERLVQAALETLMRNRTTIVIAHRLATVVRADRIVVMDAGRLVTSGTHESLLIESPLYARLAALQFSLSSDWSVDERSVKSIV